MQQSYFYTETAFIHQGEIAYLMNLIKISAKAGAKGIKFQVIGDYDDFISSVNPNYEPFKKAMITKDDWTEIFSFTKESGLDIIYMPCDKKAAHYANDIWSSKISFVDIHPVNFNYEPILTIIKEGPSDLILGVGGRVKQEIDRKIDFFGDKIKVLMFGHQAFPTDLWQSAIGKIPMLKLAYPQIAIGYADHSRFDSPWARYLNSVAYMLGARFFEKHVAVKAGEERFDYIASSDGASIKQIIDDIALLDSRDIAFPDITMLNASEEKYTSRQVKAVASRDMKPGEVLSASDVLYKMIESEKGFPYEQDPVGKKLKEAVGHNFPFTQENIQQG